MRKAGYWLDRQPAWRYVLIVFPVMFVTIALGAYAAAWLSGGPRHQIISGEMGFPNGHFSVPQVLTGAAVITGGFALGLLWRRSQRRRHAG